MQSFSNFYEASHCQTCHSHLIVWLKYAKLKTIKIQQWLQASLQRRLIWNLHCIFLSVGSFIIGKTKPTSVSSVFQKRFGTSNESLDTTCLTGVNYCHLLLYFLLITLELFAVMSTSKLYLKPRIRVVCIFL